MDGLGATVFANENDGGSFRRISETELTAKGGTGLCTEGRRVGLSFSSQLADVKDNEIPVLQAGGALTNLLFESDEGLRLRAGEIEQEDAVLPLVGGDRVGREGGKERGW